MTMTKTRKLLAALLVIVLCAAIFSACAAAPPTPPPAAAPPAAPPAAAPAAQPAADDTDDQPEQVFRIGIINFVEHPALYAAREGFLAAMRDEGIPFVYEYQNAQADHSTLATIAQRFVSQNVDLVLAITTPGVQIMAAETYSIPIVGTAITSYVAAGVVYSNEAPGHNVTGASDMNPIEAQINMIREFVPDLQTLGITFSSNEANSVLQAELARGYAEAMGLTVIEGTVTTTGEVQQVVSSVAGRADAIWIPTDNTHADAMPIVGAVSIETGTPIFPGEENMVMGGGIATLSINYFELGQQSGRMAAQILRGEGEPATMPIQFAQQYNYIVNGFMVQELGIDVPARFINSIRQPG